MPPLPRTVILVLALAGLALATDYKPEELDHTYDHARFAPAVDPGSSDILKTFRAYATYFDGADDDTGDGIQDMLGVPHWVAYELRAAPPGLGPAPQRPSPWITDESLNEARIAPDDDTYKNSGFSRGHMCMKEHAWRLGAAADWNTHTVLNACPQDQRMNAGAWLGLEKLTGDWADTFGKVWIICGPVFLRDRVPARWIGDGNEVPAAVPDAFFKIVVKDEGEAGAVEALAFIFPMYGDEDYGRTTADLTPFLTSVDVVEALTGLDFLSELDDAAEDGLERVTQSKLWE